MLNSNFGRIVLHLLAYSLAAAGVALIGQLQLYDFGQYQALASVVLGMALDAIRKYQTSL